MHDFSAVELSQEARSYLYRVMWTMGGSAGARMKSCGTRSRDRIACLCSLPPCCVVSHFCVRRVSASWTYICVCRAAAALRPLSLSCVTRRPVIACRAVCEPERNGIPNARGKRPRARRKSARAHCGLHTSHRYKYILHRTPP